MAERLLHVAACGFEAARQLALLPPGHRARAMHGHSFQAQVRAALPVGWEAFPGAGVEQLAERLRNGVAPLDYRQLDEFIEDPDDAHLARWIRERTDLPGLTRVGVRGAAHAGVELNFDLDGKGRASCWRSYRFEAAHRLPNVAPGHPCGRMHGHGFAVILRAGTGGTASELAYDRLDRCWASVARQLQHACLNDIPGLANPTSEVLGAWLWERLRPELPELERVSVHETITCGAHFDGSAYRIWKDFRLDSAVRLARAPDGDVRRRIHGHSLGLRLHLSAPLDTVLGWTVDYGDVKKRFDPIFRDLDHQSLHELPGLPDADTASLACWIRDRAATVLPQLNRIELEETPGCGVILGWNEPSAAALVAREP